MELEPTIRSREVFAGRLITVRVDEVRLPNGATTTRELVEHPGAVGIVAFTNDSELILVRQYRKAAGRLTLEVPAGTLGPGEDPLACAVRELKEETGYSAHTIHEICSFYSAIGFCTEVLHLFFASGLQPGPQATEDDESIEVVVAPVMEAVSMISQSEIVDSKTVAAVYWAHLHLAGLTTLNAGRSSESAR